MRFLRRTRQSRQSRVVAATLVASFFYFASSVAAPTAHANDALDQVQRVGEVTFDVAVLRPLWSGALIVGSLMLGPAIVFSLPGGEDAMRDAKEVFFDNPYKQVVTRPLGEF